MGLKFYLIILTRNYLCFGFLIVEEFLLIKQHSTYSIVHKLESNAIELETFPLSCSKAPTFFLYIPIFKPPSAFISREFLVLVPLTIRETTHFLFFVCCISIPRVIFDSVMQSPASIYLFWKIKLTIMAPGCVIPYALQKHSRLLLLKSIPWHHRKKNIHISMLPGIQGVYTA